MSWVLIVKGLDEQTAKALSRELKSETVIVSTSMFELVTKGPKREPSTNSVGSISKLPGAKLPQERK